METQKRLKTTHYYNRYGIFVYTTIMDTIDTYHNYVIALTFFSDKLDLSVRIHVGAVQLRTGQIAQFLLALEP